jgi:hypothetical protein
MPAEHAAGASQAAATAAGEGQRPAAAAKAVRQAGFGSMWVAAEGSLQRALQGLMQQQGGRDPAQRRSVQGAARVVKKLARRDAMDVHARYLLGYMEVRDCNADSPAVTTVRGGMSVVDCLVGVLAVGLQGACCIMMPLRNVQGPTWHMCCSSAVHQSACTTFIIKAIVLVDRSDYKTRVWSKGGAPLSQAS